MNRAFGYLRISHDPRGSSVSPDRQRQEVTRTAERKGLVVVEWFEDPDISAYTKAYRPAFEEMLTRLDEVDAVIFWELSRTARRLVVSAGLFDLLEEKGVRWISTTQGDSAEMPRDYWEMQAVQDARESRKISERVSLAHRYTAETLGRPISPKRSYGFRYDKPSRTVHIVPEEADVVRTIVRSYIAGMGPTTIARGLNDGTLLGAPVRPLRGEQWWDGTIRQLLRSPTIAGFVTYRRRVVGEEPTEPAIVDLATWEQLQAVMTTRRREGRRPGRRPRALLTGLIRCAGCTGPMASNNGRTPTYACSRGFHGQLCSEKAAMSERVLDELVLKAFWDELDRDRLEERRQARRDVVADDPDAELRRERVRLEAAVEKLAATYAESGSVSAEIFRRKAGEYEDRIRVVDDKLASSTRARVLRSALPDVERVWEVLTVEEQREVLAAYFEPIVVRRRPRGADPRAYVQIRRR